jgi:cytoskeletal protein CcmA (bactofilin family)
MRSPVDRRPAVAVLVFMAVLAVPSVAAAETTQSDLVLIREGDVVNEDLYAAGNRIQISGRIEGDLVASSVGELRIDGTIEGDVTVLASRVIIAGVVEGSVRAVATEVVVEGTVGDDLVVAGGVVRIAGTGSVGRDVLAALWRLELDGRVDRTLDGILRNGVIGGEVGSVDFDVRSLTITDSAVVSGDLAFRSSREASIADGAEVGGSLLERSPLSPNVRIVGLVLLWRVLFVVFGAGLGLSVVWATTLRAERSARVLMARPLPSIGQGLAIVALPFVLIGGVIGVATFMSPEASLPLIAGAIPFGLALLGVLALAALISPVPPAIVIGRRLAAERSIYAQFLVGYVALVVLALIPIIGSYVFLAVFVAGVGGWLTAEPPAETDLQST